MVSFADKIDLTAPELGGGLLTLSAGAAVTVSTYFLATASALFGCSATVSYDSNNGILGPPQVIYSNTLGSATTVNCQTDYTTGSGDFVTGFITCNNYDSDFATGTATLSFVGASTSFGFYVGATSTVTTAMATSTYTYYGNPVYLSTATETTYETTITSTSTVTLTGDLSTSYCTPTTTTATTTGATTAEVTTSQSSTQQATTSHSSATKATTPAPSCTKDQVYGTLASHSSIAGYFCKDLLLQKHLTFPTSISVWPAKTISSACSCYATMLAKRQAPNYGTFKAYPVTAYSTVDLYIATDSVTSTSTISVYTADVDGHTSIVSASSVSTLDLRTAPTTCVPSPAPTKRSTEPPTCKSFGLQTAYLYVEVADPVYFCNYYLSAKRTQSPLLGLSALQLTNTCSCVMKDANQHLPAYHADLADAHVMENAASGCNKEYARVIKGFFNQNKAFCTYWSNNQNRGMAPIPHMTSLDLYAGCRCIMS